MAVATKPIFSRALTPVIYAVLVAMWEAGARGFHVPAWILPAPSVIVLAAIDWAPELAFNSLVTSRETVVGFLVALAVSVPLAVVIAFTSLTRRILYPILLGPVSYTHLTLPTIY